MAPRRRNRLYVELTIDNINPYVKTVCPNQLTRLCNNLFLWLQHNLNMTPTHPKNKKYTNIA